MNISFTGLSNLRVRQANKTKEGLVFVQSSGNFVKTEKDYFYMNIECDLTNDASGNDYDMFKKVLKECGFKDNVNQNSGGNSGRLNLLMKKWEADGPMVSNSEFTVNGNKVALTHDKFLPLYSYMAKITRKLANLPETTQKQSVYCMNFNKSVHKEAVKYLDM